MRARGVMWVAIMMFAAVPFANATERTTAGTSTLSPECRRVQLAAQAAVQAGGPFKNHGQMVSTVARVVGAAVEAGRIDEDCASCIVQQFAQSVPVANQAPCGDLGTSADLRGAEITNNCDGPVVGSSTIAELSNGDLEVTITFTSGIPNRMSTAYWTCTNVPSGCHDYACGYIAMGTLTTDAAGQGTAKYVLGGGNPFPGKYVHMDVIDALGAIFTSVFSILPPSVAPVPAATQQMGDPTAAAVAASAATPSSTVHSVTGRPGAGLTTIEASWVPGVDCDLQILDVTGRIVQSVRTRAGSDGLLRYTWDGSVRSGGKAAAGAYFVRLGSPSMPARGMGRIVLFR